MIVCSHEKEGKRRRLSPIEDNVIFEQQETTNLEEDMNPCVCAYQACLYKPATLGKGETISGEQLDRLSQRWNIIYNHALGEIESLTNLEDKKVKKQLLEWLNTDIRSIFLSSTNELKYREHGHSGILTRKLKKGEEYHNCMLSRDIIQYIYDITRNHPVREAVERYGELVEPAFQQTRGSSRSGKTASVCGSVIGPGAPVRDIPNTPAPLVNFEEFKLILSRLGKFNDNIIYHWLKLLFESTSQTILLDPLYVQRAEPDERFLPDKIKGVKNILLPGHHEDHWFLVVARLEDKIISIYDSLHRTKKEMHQLTANKLMAGLKTIAGFAESENWNAQLEESPRQTGNDCGPHVCITAQFVQKGEFDVKYDARCIRHARLEIADHLAAGKYTPIELRVINLREFDRLCKEKLARLKEKFGSLSKDSSVVTALPVGSQSPLARGGTPTSPTTVGEATASARESPQLDQSLSAGASRSLDSHSPVARGGAPTSPTTIGEATASAKKSKAPSTGSKATSKTIKATSKTIKAPSAGSKATTKTSKAPSAEMKDHEQDEGKELKLVQKFCLNQKPSVVNPAECLGIIDLERGKNRGNFKREPREEFENCPCPIKKGNTITKLICHNFRQRLSFEVEFLKYPPANNPDGSPMKVTSWVDFQVLSKLDPEPFLDDYFRSLYLFHMATFKSLRDKIQQQKNIDINSHIDDETIAIRKRAERKANAESSRIYRRK